jgi:hypothetical protein
MSWQAIQCNKYSIAQKSVNVKHSVLLAEMFRLKPASQSVEQWCELDNEHEGSHFEQFL